jgi:acyl-CoA synthetase (AMP-forming)/AMP-acid ligase II
MDKLWLKSYPANVKHEIDPNEYASLTDLLNQAFQKHGDSPFSICMECWMSYKELDQLSQALGAWFQAQGLKPGDRIAIMLPNVPQFAVTMAAVLRADQIAHWPMQRNRITRWCHRAERETSLRIADEFAAQIHIGLAIVLVFIKTNRG